jgi:hypothetical protein
MMPGRTTQPNEPYASAMTLAELFKRDGCGHQRVRLVQILVNSPHSALSWGGQVRRKFPALLDRIARPDVLWDAWEQVRRNQGAAGSDGETLAAVEAYGVERMLEELRQLLLTGRYRPQPSRRVYIPKPGRPGEERPLSIPTVPA